MNTKLICILAGATALFGACDKTPVLTEPEITSLETAKAYIREGTTPVTLTAGHETRTKLDNGSRISWNKGDEILLFTEGDNSLQLLYGDNLNRLNPGVKKTVIVVNPATSGYFLGYDGEQIVRNSDGLSSLQGGVGVSGEVALSNLNEIRKLADKLRSNTDFLFVLERVEEGGFLLYHKASAIGLTDEFETIGSDEQYPCILGPELKSVDIIDGSSNTGKKNAVYGREEQVYIQKIGNPDPQINPCYGFYLWSGGNTSQKLSWVNVNTSAWTPWLLFDVPGTNYVFTADNAGTSATFTNTSGFSEGNDTWYAFYPASANPCCIDDLMAFTLPQTQTYEADSFGKDANVSVGVLEDDRLIFRSVCGILKLSLMGSQRVLSISVKDKAGMDLWGEGYFSASSIKSGDCSAIVKNGSNEVILDCGEGVNLQENEATDFYIVVPVGAFASGFDVEITTTSDTFTKSTSRDNSIARADIKAMPAFSLESETDDKEINIENAAVQAYMAYGPYEYFGQTSYLRSMSVPGNAYKPQGYSVSWNDRGDKVSVSVTENGKLWYTEDGIIGGSYTITNLTPGCTYTYKVDDDGTVLAEGTFNAVGQVRMVDIPDSWNCRDLGGWTGLYGKTIKYGKVFRTASLNGTFIGQNTLKDVADPDKYIFDSQKEIDRLGINAELDLRGDQTGDNVGRWGNENNPHAPSLRFTRLEGADYQQIMTDWGITDPRSRSSLVQDVAWIILELKKGKTVAFHCRIGSDRTGGVAYLIESLLGVADGDLARDYELSAFAASKNGSARYADTPNQPFFLTGSSSSYNSLTTISEKGETLQEKSYFYLNQYFSDVHINAEDLDWFICEMLGLDSYEHPDFAIDYGDANSLEYVVSIREGSGRTTYPN